MLSKQEVINKTAEICHEQNKAFCEPIGDYSQLPWKLAEPWQREAALEQVTVHFESGPISAGQSHTEWMKQKQADGWVHGNVKDGELKTHPDLVPFEELDFNAKVKDYIFNYTCRAVEQALAPYTKNKN